jgi:tRNA(Arg) A34 adenosine deaminase TadA
MKKAIDVQAAVVIAAGQAVAAQCDGTFGVGGVMLDAQGNVLQVMRNRVVTGGRPHDPTAHSERQLVDWYFAERARGAPLPPPGEVTVVTSVDPCCMCAGALLEAGFHVVVAANDTVAGVNYDLSATFPALPPALAQQARERFFYPEVIGSSCYARAASGAAPQPFFIGKTIGEQTQALCALVFDAMADKVKTLINRDVPRAALRNVRELAGDHAVVAALRGACSQALQYSAPYGEPHGEPDAGLAPFLLEAMAADRRNGGDGDACALLDAFGNLLLCMPGRLHASPIRTAYMECVRTYGALRHALEAAGVADVGLYLPHPKYGTFVLARGPADDARGFMSLGAYGSTMEGPLLPDHPRQWQYVLPRLPDEALADMAARLPPLYREVIRVRPTQVASAALRVALARDA